MRTDSPGAPKGGEGREDHFPQHIGLETQTKERPASLQHKPRLCLPGRLWPFLKQNQPFQMK